MVGADVGQHARVVGLVADAPEHDPAAGRLEDRDVDVAGARGSAGRPAGPGPVARARPSARRRGSPSDVVVPTWRPASIRMWVTSRVTVLLPFVPLMLTIGIRRSASRIQVGGASDAPAIRRCAARASRDWAPVSVARRAGDTSRSARPNAASAMARPRSTPRHRPGDDPVPGLGGPVDRQPGGALRMIGPEATDPGRDRGDAVGPLRAGTAAPSRTRAWSAGSRWPYHVRRRPTATSSLTTGVSR